MRKPFAWMFPGFCLFAASLCPAATFTVTTTADDGPGSFRQALLDANTNLETDLIQFNLPGTGVQTILPLTPYPTITGTVTIDGYSQPGAHANTLAGSDNAKLLVRLDGSQLTNGLPCALTIHASGCTVRGLILVRFSTGIKIDSCQNTVIAGNWIGLDWDGVARGMVFEGIYVTHESIGAALNNRIGGPSPADRNIISGNGRGVFFFTSAASQNSVIGNFFGTDATGTLPRGNSSEAVGVQSATNITVSQNVLCAGTGSGGRGIALQGGGGHVILNNAIGTDLTARYALGHFGDGIFAQGVKGLQIGGQQVAAPMGNRICCNGANGIFLQGCSQVVIEGNSIGSDTAGGWPLGNAEAGIYIMASDTNRVGGLVAAARNWIQYNGGPGISILSGRGNDLAGNYIYDNGGLAIDLGADGATPNDPGDADIGANDLQNSPTLTNALSAYGSAQIQGYLDSAPLNTYRLEFFGTLPWDADWIPECQVSLGWTNVQTDVAGMAVFSVAFPAASPEYSLITATATDATGNTSEVSAPVAPANGPASVSLTATRQNGTLTLSWPSAASAFQLESTTSLTPPVAWTAVTDGIADNGTIKSFVVNMAATPHLLFRLKR